MKLRNPFRPSVVRNGNQVVSCKHEHWKPWRTAIIADTTTCGDFNCHAHVSSLYLYGRQCLTLGCGRTWRFADTGVIPTTEWRERGGSERGPVVFK